MRSPSRKPSAARHAVLISRWDWPKSQGRARLRYRSAARRSGCAGRPRAGHARSGGATTAARPWRRSHWHVDAEWWGATGALRPGCHHHHAGRPGLQSRQHRDIGDQPAVDEGAPRTFHRGQHPGNGRAGQQRGLQVPLVEQHRSTGDQVGGHRGERDRQCLDLRGQPGPGDQPAQAAIGEDAAPRGQVAERIHVTATQLGPHVVQPRRGPVGVGGRDSPVEGTHRGSDDHVWGESVALQRVPDTDMRRSEHTTGAHHHGHGTGKGVQTHCGGVSPHDPPFTSWAQNGLPLLLGPDSHTMCDTVGHRRSRATRFCGAECQ